MGGCLTPNTPLPSSVYPLRRNKPRGGGRHKTYKGMGRVGVKLAETAKYVLHSPHQTNTGSELAPALNQKKVAASAFDSPPELNAGDQVGDHSHRKSYSQLASGQPMYTGTEATTCSTASHFHICTRVKGPACHQRVKK